MQPLNFPVYPLRIQQIKKQYRVFDRIRKKYIVLTPEEWVRQHLVWYLIEELKYPEGLINLEYSFTVNNNPVRCDLIVFSSDGKPLLLAECKAPSISIGNTTLQQAGRYNIVTRTNWLIVTNGLKHLCCKVDHKDQKITFANEMPYYQDLSD